MNSGVALNPSDQYTQSSTLALDTLQYWIADRQIRLSERQLVLGQFAEKFRLPDRSGKTLRVTRHKRLPVPHTPLTEGVPPPSVALVVENVDVTVEQWGIVALLTDVALVTPRHPALRIAIDRKSQAMSEMFEREIAQTLLGGTTVFFPAAVTTRAGLDAEKLDTATVLKTTVHLRNKGAAAFAGGLYGGVMSPQVEGDLISADTTFKEASQFSDIRRLEYAEIGVWMSVRWGRGNFLPIFKGVAAPTTADPTSEKTEVDAVDTGGSLSSGNYQFKVVARDAQSGHERKISVQSANISSGTGNNDKFVIHTPSSTAYVYDIYATVAGGTTAFLVFSRVPADTEVELLTNPDTAAKVAPANPADTKTVYVSWVFGRDAYGRVELDRMSLQSYITPPGPSWSNPLAQGRKVGSKVMWKSFILDNDFFARIETTSAFASGLPA